jgi:hypothetical protein
MDSPGKLSALTIFADVVADATRRFNAGKLDTFGLRRTLERQGFTPAQASAEARAIGSMKDWRDHGWQL